MPNLEDKLNVNSNLILSHWTPENHQIWYSWWKASLLPWDPRWVRKQMTPSYIFNLVSYLQTFLYKHQSLRATKCKQQKNNQGKKLIDWKGKTLTSTVLIKNWDKTIRKGAKEEKERGKEEEQNQEAKEEEMEKKKSMERKSLIGKKKTQEFLEL